MTVIINFWGGPGSGKSTWASFLFYSMKQLGYKVELVTEFAKDLTYERDFKTLKANWPLVLGEQLKRQTRLVGKVDYIITDSPLALSVIYSDLVSPAELDKEIMRLKESYGLSNEIDVRVKRTKPYRKYGRGETRLQALEVDKAITAYLGNYFEVKSQPDGKLALTLIELARGRFNHEEEEKRHRDTK